MRNFLILFFSILCLMFMFGCLEKQPIFRDISECAGQSDAGKPLCYHEAAISEAVKNPENAEKAIEYCQAIEKLDSGSESHKNACLNDVAVIYEDKEICLSTITSEIDKKMCVEEVEASTRWKTYKPCTSLEFIIFPALLFSLIFGHLVH
ncbi:hypothetical protein JXB01_03690 [Candidatus Micrarchaeota archaeon]|nr:hypothetical protein [Candidatus Micrarchaeota archaeon]